MDKGSIIILNGVSSSGKTTLAKVLQERLSSPYFNMDVDAFCLMAPRKFNIDDYSVQHEFVSDMSHAIKLFSDLRYNLIVPCLFWEGNKAFLDKCVALLHDYSVLFVHLTCPLDELRRREKQRKDRNIGMAENLLSMLIPQDIYDIKVDTYQFSVKECADRIIEVLDSHDRWRAFNTLWKHMQSYNI